MRRILLLWSLLLCLASPPAWATCGARGFGSTLGSGTADSVATGYTTAASTTVSFSAWFYRNGAGGGNLGRIFDQNGASATQLAALLDNTNSIASTMAFSYGANLT